MSIYNVYIQYIYIENAEYMQYWVLELENIQVAQAILMQFNHSYYF